jgi:hypothetical protein
MGLRRKDSRLMKNAGSEGDFDSAYEDKATFPAWFNAASLVL